MRKIGGGVGGTERMGKMNSMSLSWEKVGLGKIGRIRPG
jgi:hypothetical protein